MLASTEELVELDPYRESFWAARIRAFALAGRTVDAVRCYQDVRARFIDETGIEPSARLVDLERAVLAGEIAAPVAEADGPGGRGRGPDGPPPEPGSEGDRRIEGVQDRRASGGAAPPGGPRPGSRRAPGPGRR